MDLTNIYNMALDKIDKWIHILYTMLPNFIAAVLVIIFFYFLARFVRKFSGRILKRVSRHTSINNLLIAILFLTTIIAGLFFALIILNLSQAVVSLLAGVGIIGLALGFAFQDLAANFISGVAIAIGEPYTIGDLIETDKYFGKVNDINLRTTNIITPQGHLVMIPNKQIFQAPFTNYSITNERRVEIKFGVAYAEDLDKVTQTAIDAIKNIPHQIENRPVDVIFTEFGDSTIKAEVRFWISFIEQNDFRHASSIAMMKLKHSFAENIIQWK